VIALSIGIVMRTFSIFILTTAMLLNAGCAVPTPYQQANDSLHEDYGYYDDKPEPQKDGALRIRVGVNVNADTSDETIRTYWRRRVAELCGGPMSGNDAEIKQWLQSVAVSENGSPDADGNCHRVECWTISSKVIQVGKRLEPKKPYLGDLPTPVEPPQKRMEYTSEKNLEGYVYCPSK